METDDCTQVAVPRTRTIVRGIKDGQLTSYCLLHINFDYRKAKKQKCTPPHVLLQLLLEKHPPGGTSETGQRGLVYPQGSNAVPASL